jgi:hypothetical protein
MRGANTNARIPRSVSSVEKECGVTIETVMRIRPLLKKERDDTILLEERKSDGAQVAILNPLKPHLSTHADDRRDPDSTSGNVPIEYHFNHVLPESTNQDKIFYTLGPPIVTATMNSLKNTNSTRMPESHLIISTGVENSGKTYSCFGGMIIPKRRSSHDGLVPRLLDSLFSQSSHTGGSSKGFTVQISMMQVTQPKEGQRSDPDSYEIHDLLANPSTPSKNRMFGASPKKKKNLNVRNMAARFERVIPSPVARRTQKAPDVGAVLDAENLKPTIQNCHDTSEAREVLQTGLSTSQKISTGNQKFGLYITLQPVIDGTKIGDKICVLDMPGLEKENMMRSTPGKAANDAMFNCLRTLKHNSNVIDNNSSSSRKKLKPVPFRDHKVTMLLNPLFFQSSFVKITVLLAAYPGHTDFQQKRILLRDVEMLHGMTLGVPARATVVHDSMNQHMGSEVSDRNNQNEFHNDERAVHVPSSSRRDERPSRHSQKETRNLRASVRVSPSAPRMIEVQAIHKPRGDYPLAEPIPIAIDSVRRSNVRTVAHKQQDKSSLVYRKPNERKVEPSAPALSEVQESYLDSRKLKECAVDFPGVQISPNIERRAETGSFSMEKNRSVPATTRPRRNSRDTREGPIVATRVEKSSLHEGHFVRKQFEIGRKGELKSPLGRSSLENCDQYTSQEKESTSNCFEADFSNFEHMTEGKNEGQIKKLEKKLKETLQEKKTLEQICSQLEKENAELKKLSREAGRKTLQPERNQQQEEENRRRRLEAQNRIKSPVQKHLDRVNYIYDIKNQWCMTNKQHFSLSVPDHFQRAPVLDIRDRENENIEDLKILTKNETHSTNGLEIKKNGLPNMRLSVTPTRQRPSQKVVKSPEGLSALRRLVGKTSKD